MSLITYDPWRALEKAENEMKHFFDDFRMGFPLSTSFEMSKYTPRIDTSEDEKNVYVSAELPGMTTDDLKITLSGDMLTIEGKKERKEEIKKKNFHRIERSFGEFIRQMELPEGLYKKENITAKLEEGILEVTIPKDIAKMPIESMKVIPISNGKKK
jgi:HSP20 family protein